MDVLTRLRKPALAIALVGIVVGCALIRSLTNPEKPYVFSHRLHVGDQELSCDDCHYGEPDTPGMPTLDDCQICHEELDEENEPGRRVTSLFDGDVYRALHASRITGDVLFDHDSHADGYVEDCASCHRGIESSRRILASDFVTMDTCTSCHSKSGLEAADCSLCHDEIDKTWQPPDHARSWQRLHGEVVRCGATGADTAQQCSLCHEESACVACHKVTPPRDHNNYYRLRGHGIAASIDRNRCSTCHEPDGCDRCHMTTEPRSHVGSFGSPLNRHCLGCHLPLRPTNGGCTTCHRDTPSHLSAPPLPLNQPHLTARDAQCRECHIPGRLRHPDNGDSCRFCHR